MNSPCPNISECGSCGWSHIPYPKQLEQKLADINGAFALKKLDLHCKTIIAAEKTEHYRNRMDFVIDFEGRVGLRQKGKWWRVIDNHPCFLADERIEAHFRVIRDWAHTADLSYFDRKAHTGLLRYAVIRATHIGQTMITIVTSAPADTQEEECVRTALQELATVACPTTLVWAVNHTIADVSFAEDIRIISGEGVIHEQINDARYQISPNAFFQTNSLMAPVLLHTVQEYCGDLSGKTLLDLYCGTGFFTVALAKHTKRTIGVELVKDAIKDAKENATLNDARIEWHDAGVENFDWGAFNAHVVIVDPPRSGMHDKALADLIRIAPDTLIYVSCNYKNFAREYVQLQNIYAVENMTAIDQFPHTPHVELVVKLAKRPS